MAVCVKSLEKVLKFKYLRTTAKDENYIDKEIQRILNSVNFATKQFTDFCIPYSIRKRKD
jgi:hypothetical protein